MLNLSLNYKIRPNSNNYLPDSGNPLSPEQGRGGEG